MIDFSGRTPISVKDHDRVTLSNPKRNVGSWTKAEEAELTKLVHEVMKTTLGTNVDADVPWKAVATRLKTRTEKQCRQKWNGELNWKLRCPVADLTWGRYDNIKLMGVHDHVLTMLMLATCWPC